MLDIRLAKHVSLEEIINLHRKHPEGYSPPRRDYNIYEVTTPMHIYRVLAKDELDAYRVYLEEYRE